MKTAQLLVIHPPNYFRIASRYMVCLSKQPAIMSEMYENNMYIHSKSILNLNLVLFPLPAPWTESVASLLISTETKRETPTFVEGLNSPAQGDSGFVRPLLRRGTSRERGSQYALGGTSTLITGPVSSQSDCV